MIIKVKHRNEKAAEYFWLNVDYRVRQLSRALFVRYGVNESIAFGRMIYADGTIILGLLVDGHLAIILATSVMSLVRGVFAKRAFIKPTACERADIEKALHILRNGPKNMGYREVELHQNN